MNREMFLEAVRASLYNKTVSWTEPLAAQEWDELFRMASAHQILPMIYQSVYKSVSFKESDFPAAANLKNTVRRQTVTQIMKTSDLTRLYKTLLSRDLKPLVVKGVVCRSLYPNPDLRLSGDEDIYMQAGRYEEYHKAFSEAGMEIVESDRENADTLQVVTYRKKDGVLHVELHRSLFNEGEALKGMNELFSDVFENAIALNIDGATIYTMCHTDHLLFLIVHAFKHFIYSGFGIRQVCDIIMYAAKYGKEIDWEKVLGECEKFNGDVFAAALFDMGEKHLGFDFDKACIPDEWRERAVDSTELLDDLLSGGVFGDSSMDRRHSANITLGAVAMGKQGKKAKASVIKAMFPPKSRLEGDYSYLKKYPVLLPAAWAQRLFKYGMENLNSDNSAAKTLEIGNKRVELLKKYKITR